MKPAKNSLKSVRLSILFLLVGTIAFFGWNYYKNGFILDESKLSGKFETAINELLDRHGIQDIDIRNAHRIERKKKFPIPTYWIETEREIALPSQDSFQTLIRDIQKSAPQFGLSVQVSSSPFQFLFEHERVGREPRKIIVECVRNNQIFQKIIFLPFVEESKTFQRKKPQVAIVIDDLAGRTSDLENLENFSSLGIPLTYAILPREQLSGILAEKIHQSGNEVIVHQPMEPEDIEQHDPGKSVLMVQMKISEMQEILRKNFKSVPYAIGISNHMGSRFTGNFQAMDSFLVSLKNVNDHYLSNKIFFFDSHTHPKPAGKEICQKLGVNYLLNDIFLDNEDDLGEIVKQIALLKRQAKKKGYAIAIGHIQRQYTAAALRQSIFEFQKSKIEFVHLSDIILRQPIRSQTVRPALSAVQYRPRGPGSR